MPSTSAITATGSSATDAPQAARARVIPQGLLDSFTYVNIAKASTIKGKLKEFPISEEIRNRISRTTWIDLTIPQVFDPRSIPPDTDEIPTHVLSQDTGTEPPKLYALLDALVAEREGRAPRWGANGYACGHPKAEPPVSDGWSRWSPEAWTSVIAHLHAGSDKPIPLTGRDIREWFCRLIECGLTDQAAVDLIYEAIMVRWDEETLIEHCRQATRVANATEDHNPFEDVEGLPDFTELLRDTPWVDPAGASAPPPF